MQKKLHFQPHPFKILIKGDPTSPLHLERGGRNFNIRADSRGEVVFAILTRALFGQAKERKIHSDGLYLVHGAKQINPSRVDFYTFKTFSHLLPFFKDSSIITTKYGVFGYFLNQPAVTFFVIIAS